MPLSDAEKPEERIHVQGSGDAIANGGGNSFNPSCSRSRSRSATCNVCARRISWSRLRAVCKVMNPPGVQDSLVSR
jgi:hypothetical protein